MFIIIIDLFFRGSNYFTGRISGRTSYQANRLLGQRRGRHVVSNEAKGGDQVDRHVPVHDRRHLLRRRSPIRRPNTLRHRRTTRQQERGTNRPIIV